MTESGLLASSHLVGVTGVRTALKNGDLRSVVDGNGTTVLEYMTSFAGYDISEIKTN